MAYNGFDLDQFRTEMEGGVSRPNLFKVYLDFPSSVITGEQAKAKSPFMVKAAVIPASKVSSIDVGYFGRKLKVTGDRTFDNLKLTVYNDENFAVRRALEEWLDRMSGHRIGGSQFRGGNGQGPSGNGNSYTTTLRLEQLGRQGNVLREYRFIGAFPVDVAEMQLDWGTNDTVQDFTCDFAYQWWEVDNEIPTNGGGGVSVNLDLRFG